MRRLTKPLQAHEAPHLQLGTGIDRGAPSLLVVFTISMGLRR
jgi:hypothetical protein